MNEKQDEKNVLEEESEEKGDKDDLQQYLREIKALETDFSDLEDLEMEELKEMQDAISMVKEGQISLNEHDSSQDELNGVHIDGVNVSVEKTISNKADYNSVKEAMITDFSDIDEIGFDELKEMKDAIEGVKRAELEEAGDSTSEFKPEPLSTELEERIKEELQRRKESVEQEEKIITPEIFLEYIKNKRDKIWYHALWYITFETEDYIASKEILYDALKEATSKSVVDPIPQHQFNFGLGYILRLNINKKQIIRYLPGGKFKININIESLKELLQKAGEPISTRPVITEEEEKKMFSDFLKDDFLDI
ncbi:MAG: hypothetical protein ACTSQJ_05320 [Promethearchaeota archaeon]